jgi:hypothetical protein
MAHGPVFYYYNTLHYKLDTMHRTCSPALLHAKLVVYAFTPSNRQTRFLLLVNKRQAVLEHLDGDLEEVVQALGLGLGRLPSRTCTSAKCP